MHEQATADVQRERRGAHYTPAELVAEVVDPVLDVLLADGVPDDLVVVDPACGAGAFLLHTHARIAARLAAARVPEPDLRALDHVIGADRDPWAARLARLALALRADAPLHRPRILLGDALLGPTTPRPGPAVPGAIDWSAELPAGATAVVGNPPFLGGKRLLTVLGADAAEALRARRELSGNVDLAVHFLHLAAELVRPGGHVALVLTDTIAQGENHRFGLAALTPEPLTLLRARTTRPWPGDAHVNVALVHAVRGPSQAPRELDGRPVSRISSRLRADRLDRVPPPRPEPRPDAFIGCDIKGTGFLFGAPHGHDPALLDALAADDPHLHEVIRPYVTGRTLSRVPGAVPQRQVADLTGLDLDAAQARHPGLLKLLAEAVRADRLTRSPEVARAPWWQFWRTRPALRAAIAPLPRCLVAPVVARDLTFSWQPTDRVFSHKVLVVATADDHVLGALQCSLHRHWATALSSTLGAGLNYAPSRCYRTYPMPPRDRAIAAAAHRFDQVRSASSSASNLALGPLHAAVRTGDRRPEVQAVRDALRDLDAAVLAAWGWTDLDPDDASAVVDRLLDAPSG